MAAEVGLVDRLRGLSPVAVVAGELDFGNEKSLGTLPLVNEEEFPAGIFVISTRSIISELSVEGFLLPDALRLSIVNPAGKVGVDPLEFDPGEGVWLADAALLGSKDMVFFLPRLVVPGTFGPVEEEVYLMSSVSEGSFKESINEGLAVPVEGEDLALALLLPFDRLLLP